MNLFNERHNGESSHCGDANGSGEGNSGDSPFEQTQQIFENDLPRGI